MPDNSEFSPFNQQDAVLIGTSWINYRAEQHGIRALIIKGPIAHTLGLRSNKVSADVDVLVEPGRFNDLLKIAGKANWLPRAQSGTPKLLDAHSVTLSNSGWPIDLDVHSYWPGFLTDAKKAFDHLWEERQYVTLGGVEIATPATSASALILALHILRRPVSDSGERELADLAGAVGDEDRDPSLKEVLAQAAALNATQTARPFLTRVGAHVPESLEPNPQLRIWQLNSQARGNTVAWMESIAEASPAQKLLLLRRAILPSPRSLRVMHPELPPGLFGLIEGWAKRIRAGIINAIPSLRVLFRFRKGRLPDTSGPGSV